MVSVKTIAVFSAFCLLAVSGQETPENSTESKTIRRQVPAFAAGAGILASPGIPLPASLLSPPPVLAAPVLAAPPAPVFAAPPAPVFAAPPAPVFAAPPAQVFAAPPPAAVFAAPAPPPPAPVFAAPQLPACQPACIGNAQCVSGTCACPTPVAYSPVVGCAPVPPPVPVVSGRLIPQALPGAPCEPGVECTGGSVCSMGTCLCPPELVQEGTVCVLRTIYGVVPPPPAVVPAAIPVAAAPVALAPAPVPALIPVGAPCVATAPTPCTPGAFCSPAQGVCTCGPAFSPAGPSCIRQTKVARA